MTRRSAPISLVAMTAAAIMTHGGCAPGDQPVPPPEIRIGAVEDGTVVTLTPDQVLTIALDARPALGYSWRVDAIAPALLSRLPDVHEGSGEMGGTDRQILRFIGAGTGELTLRLAYGKPWEDTPAEATYSVKIIATGPFSGVLPPEPAALTEAPETYLAALPERYNLCEKGGCTPVKNQGSCGSCWAFATAGVVESAILVKDGVTRDVSEQYLISCNSNAWSCSGGSAAFSYFINKFVSGEAEAGAVYEADLPYQAKNGTCAPPHAHHEKLVSASRVGTSSTPSVDQIKQAIFDKGAVWASMCADSTVDNYRSGVYAGSASCTKANHAIVLTGWDDADGVWILRNSWGTRWGENSGYMRIKWGVNLVGGNAMVVTYGSGGGSGGSTGSGGAGGAGGMAGSGGRPGSGGAIGSGGRMGSGGVIGSGGGFGSGGRIGSGGAIGSGGRFGSGGAIGSGGRIGSGGAIGSGGRFGSGGRMGSGGAIGSGGSDGSGGEGGEGGAPGSGGIQGSGGRQGTGGAPGAGGRPGSDAGSPDTQVPGTDAGIQSGGSMQGHGCGCSTGGDRLPAALTSLLAGVFLLRRRSRRAAR